MKSINIWYGAVLLLLIMASCNNQKTVCCGNKVESGCSKNCSAINLQKMTNSSETCSKCGKNSCYRNCAANSNDTIDFKSMVPSCSLTNSEMADRKEFLQATMVKKIFKVEELETGYDLIFHEPMEYSKDLLEFINFERNCCSSFSFALVFEPNNKATHLQMYGSKEIKEELKRGFIEVGFLKK